MLRTFKAIELFHQTIRHSRGNTLTTFIIAILHLQKIWRGCDQDFHLTTVRSIPAQHSIISDKFQWFIVLSGKLRQLPICLLFSKNGQSAGDWAEAHITDAWTWHPLHRFYLVVSTVSEIGSDSINRAREG